MNDVLVEAVIEATKKGITQQEIEEGVSHNSQEYWKLQGIWAVFSYLQNNKKDLTDLGSVL